MVVGLASAASVFGQKFSVQNLWTVSEYFQLLLTFLLLKTEMPGKVYSLLKSFELFKIDLEFLNSFIPVNNGVSNNILTAQGSSARFGKIDINFMSTLLNFFFLIIMLSSVCLAHTLIQYFTSLPKYGKEIKLTKKDHPYQDLS